MTSILAIIGVICFRVFIENFSDLDEIHPIGIIQDPQILFGHYLPWFLTVFLSIAIVTKLLSRRPITEILRFLAWGSPVILLAPLLDIIWSQGQGLDMSYCNFTNWQDFWFYFATFFGIGEQSSTTIGIKAEVVAIVFGLGIFTYTNTKAIWRGILTTIFSYSTIYLAGTFAFWGKWFIPSFENNLLTFLSANSTFTAERYAGLFFSCTFVILLYYVLRLADKKAVDLIVHNIRLERGALYIFLATAGFGLAIYQSNNIVSLASRWEIIIVLLAITAAWSQAALINDITDVRIDSIQNTNRALVKGKLQKKDYTWASVLFIALAFFLSFQVSYVTGILVMNYMILTWFYSIPPFRWRRFPLLPNFVIGLASLLSVLAGYSVLIKNNNLAHFPSRLALLIILVITVISIMKDLKDIVGDEKNGVTTIPTWLANRIGKTKTYHIVGIIIASSFVTTSILITPTPNIWLVFFGSLFAFLIYLLIGIFRAKDKYYLYTSYVFIAFLVFLIGMLKLNIY
jgi:4-hydroxybenzoate polyprenyltransferase